MIARARLRPASASWLAVAALAACGAGAPAPASPSGPAPAPAAADARPPSGSGPADFATGLTEHGKATYYSDALAGRKTASGERYDPAALTAAHRRLPFGTVVEVTRRDGRRVTVRINDRGPFAKGRIIDLSRRAAEEIGLVRDGVTEVSLRVVSRPN